MTSGTGSAIQARDFNKNTKDPLRDEWGPGAMQHLVNALNGSPVAIVLDKHTGFAEVNVTLGGVRQTPGYGTFQVLVKRVYSDGTTGGCWYPLYQVGTVIVLDRGSEGMGARYNALMAYMDERSAASRKLQAEMVADAGVEDPSELPRGKWEVRSFPGYVHASFSPEKILGPGRYTWKRYETADLLAEKV